MKDFLKMNALDGYKTGVEIVSDYHHIAFLVVQESEMKDLRDRLKPHRGQIYS